MFALRTEVFYSQQVTKAQQKKKLLRHTAAAINHFGYFICSARGEFTWSCVWFLPPSRLTLVAINTIYLNEPQCIATL